MRGEDSGETHVGINRQRRHSLVQPWMKYHRKLRGFYEVRGTCSRVWGNNRDIRAGS